MTPKMEQRPNIRTRFACKTQNTIIVIMIIAVEVDARFDKINVELPVEFIYRIPAK